ncbi:type I restriction enzyme HsdR N-terminal domain-containing protein [Sphingobacterium sp. SYP-B4668]|uniref:type I restriction enzyme HsdR N-terminal domain-containing protein n=1 Tax=Sphingobacterium sp. SYP-B4668 TaxID=2996035 RepID=UPI0022DD0C5E|nr:type I restriction enzyme HsdR N-terminal domain-containing protein [Sphingobacterium sp. SYP-B4668]
MFTPIQLNLPPYPAKLTKENETVFIFDELRKKRLVLTPEEWVRQHWIHYLHQQKKYPKSLMKTEGSLKLNTLQKRSDLLIYNSLGKKIILAEFKAPNVKITQAVFEQIANYNTIHQIPLLLVSNGLEHFYCKISFDSHSYEFLKELPDYDVS